MTKVLILLCVTILSPGLALAKSHPSVLAPSVCEQVRQAVALYGVAFVKQYALDHYGKEAVAYGARCLINRRLEKE